MSDRAAIAAIADPAIDTGLRSFLTAVYNRMAIAVAVSGLVAWGLGVELAALLKGAEPALLPASLLLALYASPLKWVVIFGPLVAALALGVIGRSLSASGLRIALLAFSGLMGASLASIFVVYTGFSIAQAFLGATILFAVMATWGNVTGRSLESWGGVLMAGVVALILASLANLALGSGPLEMAISAVALIVFAAMTAYDAQRLKAEYVALSDRSPDDLDRAASFGALSLYLDFVNLFVALLRLFGSRQD